MEKQKPKTWKLISALALIVVSAGVGIGTTVALFTSEKTIDSHLVIGSGLKASMYLTNVKSDVLNADTGMIEADKEVDLSGYKGYDKDNKRVDLAEFDGDIFGTTKWVPTMKGEATFSLVNDGDVAFKVAYTRDIKSFDVAGNEITDSTSNRIQDQFSFTESSPSDVVTKGGKIDFTIAFEFLDKENNNDVQGQLMSIDLKFVLTQVTRSDSTK